MITHKYDDFFIGTETIKDCYIYGWVCENWGGVYFYVGKGCGNRYKSLHNRSRAFMSIVNHWTCFPVILKQGLTEEQAFAEEVNYKEMFLLDLGCPIIDGEGDKALVKNLSAKRGKAIAREKGIRVDGRPEKDIPLPLLQNFLKKQKDGELTVNQCCSELGIGRTTWYKKIALLSNKCYN